MTDEPDPSSDTVPKPSAPRKETMTLERYEAALAGAEPVTYHKHGCPAATSMGWYGCDPNPNICGALAEHRLKLEAVLAN